MSWVWSSVGISVLSFGSTGEDFLSACHLAASDHFGQVDTDTLSECHVVVDLLEQTLVVGTQVGEELCSPVLRQQLDGFVVAVDQQLDAEGLLQLTRQGRQAVVDGGDA